MTKTFSELGKIEAIRLLLEKSGLNSGNSFIGIDGGIVHSVSRLFIEGTDFDLTYFPLQHLGYKCVVAVAGELYAEMAHTQTLSVKLGVSAKLDFPQIELLWEGMTTAAKEHGFSNIDLDLIPSRNGLIISIYGCGVCKKETINKRSEAKSKDLICLSGSIGAAYLGQQILEKGKRGIAANNGNFEQSSLEQYKMIIGDYLKPELNANIVTQLEEDGLYPSYGYFVYNGLADAVKRLVRDSGLGAKIYANMIPFEGNSFQAGKELDIDPVSAAMNGGNDCRLLFTIPILQAEKFRRDFQTYDVIGHLAQSDVGAALVTPEGVELKITAPGWKENTEE